MLERAPHTVHHISIPNEGTTPASLRLEPWGAVVRIPPQSCAHLIARGPDGGKVELARTRAATIAYAWPGATLRVECAGVELLDHAGLDGSTRSTAPWLPPGMRTREWMEAHAATIPARRRASTRGRRPRTALRATGT